MLLFALLIPVTELSSNRQTHEMKLRPFWDVILSEVMFYPIHTSGSAKEVNRNFNFLGVIILVGCIVIMHMILCWYRLCIDIYLSSYTAKWFMWTLRLHPCNNIYAYVYLRSYNSISEHLFFKKLPGAILRFLSISMLDSSSLTIWKCSTYIVSPGPYVS